MKAIQFLIGFAVLALASSLASAYDPSPLQDICVAINNPKDGGLGKPGNTANRLGVDETDANVEQIPGLNTLGISAFRIDYAPYGQRPPHIHPRASEILLVLEGTLHVGFVTSDQLNNTLISKVLNKGDAFVFPIGLIHFQFNIGKTNAVAYSALNSQFPGEITIADAVFGANPPINPDFLAKAFQLDPKTVKDLQHKFINGH
ncbi:Germin-like protein subfamily 1 member 17 [Citrus sinensis]|nr:Germin-like protein subfamily 1 member 17 [Citrus sinensis]